MRRKEKKKEKRKEKIHSKPRRMGSRMFIELNV